MYIQHAPAPLHKNPFQHYREDGHILLEHVEFISAWLIEKLITLLSSYCTAFILKDGHSASLTKMSHGITRTTNRFWKTGYTETYLNDKHWLLKTEFSSWTIPNVKDFSARIAEIKDTKFHVWITHSSLTYDCLVNQLS